MDRAVNEAWVIWDYGPDTTTLTNTVELRSSPITVGAQALNTVIDLGAEESNNVQIPITQTNATFNTAINSLIQTQQVWFPLPGVTPVTYIRIRSITSTLLTLDFSRHLGVDSFDRTITSPATGRYKFTTYRSMDNQVEVFSHTSANALRPLYFGTQRNNADIVDQININGPSEQGITFTNNVLTMPVLGSITNRDVWRITGTGTNAASFVPAEQNLTISVREDYRFAPTTGVNYIGTTTTIGPTTVTWQEQ